MKKYLNRRVQSIASQFKADLIVAFARGAVRNERGFLLLGSPDETGRDAGTSQASSQQVAILVNQTGIYSRP